jgi:hypothetical protein
MSLKILEIAESAGFILTENKKSVDWSSNYDDALVNLGKLDCSEMYCNYSNGRYP